MIRSLRTLSFAALLIAHPASAQLPNPNGGPVEPGSLPARWDTGGPNCLEVPDWQVHEFNPDFIILRQSGCTNYEKPFLYLIFGTSRVLLVDTGAGQPQTGPIVHHVISQWLERHQKASIRLTVIHSHGHGDHQSGDKFFQNDPQVDFIAGTPAAVQKATGITHWPQDTGRLDLGGRLLDIVPIPGHHDASIAIYDARTGILLTGDSLYPGRLYVADWPAFVASTDRLAAFTENKLITYILGCHIEQARRPFLDYPIGSMYQPDEHPIDLGRAQLLELQAALHQHRDQPVRMAFRDFTVWPLNPEVIKEMERVSRETSERQMKNKWKQPN